MLTFVGLGLYDERSITVEGRDAIRAADRVFAEAYTSRLAGATVADLETYHDVEIEVRERDGVERDPEAILSAAETEDVAFLVGGDPMISTTHVDLRLRAIERDVETRVIHGTTAQTAASSLTGLQNYRFGRSVTIPFPSAHGGDGLPESVVDAIEDNRERGLHTICYLDISVDPADRRVTEDSAPQFMTADVAAALLAEELPSTLAVAIARAGSPDPLVEAATTSELAERDFGDPLHLLVIPGPVHLLEADALVAIAGADRGDLEVL